VSDAPLAIIRGRFRVVNSGIELVILVEYGHSRLTERILTGVTRGMFGAAPMAFWNEVNPVRAKETRQTSIGSFD
jgi:hypothetical protein